MKWSMYRWIKVLACVGIFLAAYLLYEQFFQPSFEPCRINSVVNCEAIIKGEVSKTLGIPTPLYGFIGYSIILFAAFFKKKKLIFSMASFGLAFCLYIAYKEIFQLHVICPVCIVCQGIMLTVFILSFLLVRKKS